MSDNNLLYIVTLKYPKNPNHDPRNKVHLPCKMSESCSDSTGSHHSMIVYAESLEQLHVHFKDRGLHVTRIELAQNHEVILS